MTHNEHQHNRLEQLPLELRKQVYGYVLHCERPVRIPGDDFRSRTQTVQVEPKPRDPAGKFDLSLLHVSKAVRHDGLEVFFEINSILTEPHPLLVETHEEYEENLFRINRCYPKPPVQDVPGFTVCPDGHDSPRRIFYPTGALPPLSYLKPGAPRLVTPDPTFAKFGSRIQQLHISDRGVEGRFLGPMLVGAARTLLEHAELFPKLKCVTFECKSFGSAAKVQQVVDRLRTLSQALGPLTCIDVGQFTMPVRTATRAFEFRFEYPLLLKAWRSILGQRTGSDTIMPGGSPEGPPFFGDTRSAAEQAERHELDAIALRHNESLLSWLLFTHESVTSEAPALNEDTGDLTDEYLSRLAGSNDFSGHIKINHDIYPSIERARLFSLKDTRSVERLRSDDLEWFTHFLGSTFCGCHILADDTIAVARQWNASAILASTRDRRHAVFSPEGDAAGFDIRLSFASRIPRGIDFNREAQRRPG